MKYYYEVLKDTEGNLNLKGPVDNIYEVRSESGETYKYAQIIDGKPVAILKPNEMIETDYLL